MIPLQPEVAEFRYLVHGDSFLQSHLRNIQEIMLRNTGFQICEDDHKELIAVFRQMYEALQERSRYSGQRAVAWATLQITQTQLWAEVADWILQVTALDLFQVRVNGTAKARTRTPKRRK